jgi:hypothetical protein
MAFVLNTRSLRPGLLCLCLTVALAAASHSELRAGQRVVVELKDGEQLTAEVDSRTSSQRLWLRYAYGNAEILRPIEWDHVARGVVGSDDLEAAAFRAKALQIRSLHEPPRAKRPEASGAGSPPAGRQDAYPTFAGDGSASRQVQSIWADARLANWDADAAFDGLLLRVVPLNGYGAPIAAAGTIEAELWDDRARYPRSLGRWTCMIREGVGKPSRLPFQADDPQVDDTINRLGTLRVSFAVPGQGVFECEVSDVALRPFSQPWTAPFRTRTGTR